MAFNSVRPGSVPVHRSAIMSRYPRIVHGMSTMEGGASPAPYFLNLSFSVGDDPLNVRENRRRFAEALGLKPEMIAYQRQVHGDTVLEIEKAGTYESCDGLITRTPGIALAVSVADCMPILLHDPVTQSVSAVHAGWRGSRDRIIVRAVKKMQETFSTDPAVLVAYMGPSAGVCCYEVGEDVAAEFDAKFLMKKKEGRYHLDLKKYNTELLIACGLNPVNIESSPECTICSGGRYHSYRRDGARSGRMLAIICLTE